MISSTVRRVVLYQSNTQSVVFIGMQNAKLNTPPPNYVDNATVTATLVDQNGNPVAGCIGVVMTASGAGGNYVAVFGDNNFEPPVGDGYLLKIDAVVGGVTFGHWEIPVEIQAREH